MKTLYERLSDKNRNIINHESNKHPKTWKKILKELDGYWWHDLNLQQSMTIYAVLKENSFFNVSTFCEFFETKN